MTIRIHEADGTPYEHIVEIKEAVTIIEIPYNTKYKRLKRSRRHKERAATAAGVDAASEGNDDVLLYCLGDVLQTEDEVKEWRMGEWTKEDEEKMQQESYEWIRMDADFEWLCKMRIQMPNYMFLSQLQQDRDVVAQLEVSDAIGRFLNLCTNTGPVRQVLLQTDAHPALVHNTCQNAYGSTLFPRHTHSCGQSVVETRQAGE